MWTGQGPVDLKSKWTQQRLNDIPGNMISRRSKTIGVLQSTNKIIAVQRILVYRGEKLATATAECVDRVLECVWQYRCHAGILLHRSEREIHRERYTIRGSSCLTVMLDA